MSKIAKQTKVYTIYNIWDDTEEFIVENDKTPKVEEGEIWWCFMDSRFDLEASVREPNIRPVLVYRKLDRFLFLAMRISSEKQLDDHWHVPLFLDGKEQAVLVDDFFTTDVTKLGKYIGKLSEENLKKVRDMLKEIFQ